MQSLGDAVFAGMVQAGEAGVNEVMVNSTLVCDGAEIARASGRATAETKERTGSRAIPWQRKIASSQGSAPQGPRG